jgi:outer membrane autotransporter protein
LGSTAKLFGLVGGYEKMGPGGGAVGLTVAYMNIGDQGTADPVNAQTLSNVAEVGAYYRRAWGGLRFSLRGAGGYGWFNQRREFVTTGVQDIAHSSYNGYFADAHAGLQYEQHFGSFYVRPEVSLDYLYLNSDAYRESGGGTGFDLSVAQQVSQRATAAGLIALGTQYGHDAWFRPEIFGGYRVVAFGQLGDTVAQFAGGSPFSLAPGDTNGGWIVAGFSLKAGTPLSYVAIEGEADLSNSEQRYDVYVSGRAMF